MRGYGRLRRDHDEGSPYFVPKQMSRETLREGWVKAWLDFYTFSSMWQRYTVRPASSWIQALGYWPLNILQNRLAHTKIAGGRQRHRTAAGHTMDVANDAMAAPVQSPTPVGFAEMQTPGRGLADAVRLPIVK